MCLKRDSVRILIGMLQKQQRFRSIRRFNVDNAVPTKVIYIGKDIGIYSRGTKTFIIECPAGRHDLTQIEPDGIEGFGSVDHDFDTKDLFSGQNTPCLVV